MADRAYKAIFFDLDGTLIPMELDEFLVGYGRQIGRFFASKGYDDPEGMAKAVFACTGAMTKEHEGTNADAFWASFEAMTGCDRATYEPLFMEFYTGMYNEVGAGLEFPLAAQALKVLAEKGYELYLTTMPLFPEIGVAERLKWVGIDAGVFERITHYENSCHVKPSLDYYRETLDFAALDPADVLMVGNNTVEDLAIMELGADAFLVTDMLIDPVGFDLSQVKHGTFAEFLAFANELPTCPDPEGGLFSLLEQAASLANGVEGE